MVIDSASGTSPRSSRATIFSSSSSAFSKLSSPTATAVFSGISNVFLRGHQCLHMRRNRVAERLQIIAALEHADDPAAGVAGGQSHQHLGGGSVVLLLEIQRCQRVAPMRVETGRDDDQ